MTRVLVVDDEPAMRRTMRIYLASQGYDVDVAPHGTAALEIAAHKHPDAVLLDLGGWCFSRGGGPVVLVVR